MGSRSKTSTTTTTSNRQDLRYNYDIDQQDRRAAGSGVFNTGDGSLDVNTHAEDNRQFIDRSFTDNSRTTNIADEDTYATLGDISGTFDAASAFVAGRGNVVNIATDHGVIDRAAGVVNNAIQNFRDTAAAAARREADFRGEATRREADIRGEAGRREADIRSEAGRREETIAAFVANLARGTATPATGQPLIPRETAEALNSIAGALTRPLPASGAIPAGQAINTAATLALNRANEAADTGAAPATAEPLPVPVLAAAAVAAFFMAA